MARGGDTIRYQWIRYQRNPRTPSIPDHSAAPPPRRATDAHVSRSAPVERRQEGVRGWTRCFARGAEHYRSKMTTLLDEVVGAATSSPVSNAAEHNAAEPKREREEDDAGDAGADGAGVNGDVGDLGALAADAAAVSALEPPMKKRRNSKPFRVSLYPPLPPPALLMPAPLGQLGVDGAGVPPANAEGGDEAAGAAAAAAGNLAGAEVALVVAGRERSPAAQFDPFRPYR